MATINIPLVTGENFISFPEYSNKSFTDIFTDSGIVNSVIGFYKFDTIINNFISVNMQIEFIEQGRGYLLVIGKTTNPILIITYEGTKFLLSINFDMLKSMLLRGFNLIGVDSSVIVLPTWCRFLDASTRMQVTQLNPGKAYWIKYSEECTQSNWIIDYNVPVLISIAMFFLWTYVYLLKDTMSKTDVIKIVRELGISKIQNIGKK